MNDDQIIDQIKQKIISLAEKNNFVWFYDLHQVEIIKSSEELLKFYPEANRQVVILACWLHDIVHYTAKTPEEIDQVKESHHLEGAKIAEQILSEYHVNSQTINKVKKCIERHRNKENYKPVSIEEKIVASADSLSHFRSVFYLTYFKIYPNDSLDQMVETDIKKIERDWQDLQIIPEAKELAENKYRALKEMLSNYQEDKLT